MMLQPLLILLPRLDGKSNRVSVGVISTKVQANYFIPTLVALFAMIPRGPDVHPLFPPNLKSSRRESSIFT